VDFDNAPRPDVLDTLQRPIDAELSESLRRGERVVRRAVSDAVYVDRKAKVAVDVELRSG
jgi:hypothetical protein